MLHRSFLGRSNCYPGNIGSLPCSQCFSSSSIADAEDQARTTLDAHLIQESVPHLVDSFPDKHHSGGVLPLKVPLTRSRYRRTTLTNIVHWQATNSTAHPTEPASLGHPSPMATNSSVRGSPLRNCIEVPPVNDKETIASLGSRLQQRREVGSDGVAGR